jgi:hypothetical protein
MVARLLGCQQGYAKNNEKGMMTEVHRVAEVASATPTAKSRVAPGWYVVKQWGDTHVGLQDNPRMMSQADIAVLGNGDC